MKLNFDDIPFCVISKTYVACSEDLKPTWMSLRTNILLSDLGVSRFS
jgi:hypothetical protein